MELEREDERLLVVEYEEERLPEVVEPDPEVGVPDEELEEVE